MEGVAVIHRQRARDGFRLGLHHRVSNERVCGHSPVFVGFGRARRAEPVFCFRILSRYASSSLPGRRLLLWLPYWLHSRSADRPRRPRSGERSRRSLCRCSQCRRFLPWPTPPHRGYRHRARRWRRSGSSERSHSLPGSGRYNNI